jgi:diguanylate cyclase (GGDEF)-like protein/PAS domain S-box-containing protein
VPDPKNNSAWRRAAATLLVAGLATLLLAGLVHTGPLGLRAVSPAALLQIFGIVLLLCIVAPWAAGWADRIGGRSQPEQDEPEMPSVIATTDSLIPEERRELERTMEQMRERLAQTTVSRDYLHSVLNSMADAVFVSDPTGMIRMSNDAGCRLTGVDETQLRGRFIGSLIENPAGQAPPLLLHHARQTGETVIRTQAGQTIPVSFSGSDITIGDPQLAGSIYVLRDITDRKRSERRIRYLARYDALTKIPNRMQFQHLLQQAIARSLRSGHCIALLYLDMDRFKEINDTFGHGAGDRVLEALTERVSRVLPAGAAFGRLAGDEFAVMIDGLQRQNTRSALKQIGATILHSVGNEPVHVAEQEVFLTVSIGAAVCPDDAGNVIDLIRNADAAMYRSKQNGGNSCVFYEPEMNAAANERLVLKSKLKRAVERDELVIRYLPKVDLVSGRIVGAEALLRWQPPGHGEVPPSLFIPLAEESNLISDVGEWVLNRVCLEYGTLASRVQDPGRIALNLSLRQLRQASFILQCRSVFERHAVDPQNLELEITETTLMADPKRIVAMLRELRGMGLHLAIDDFGTGYSSLSALRQFPIGTLKIDQSFVRGAALSQGDETLVRTIIEMGRSLGMDVVAEGVETTGQLATLRRLGCHGAQGLLFGEPCTVDGLGALLTEQELGISPYASLFERAGAIG